MCLQWRPDSPHCDETNDTSRNCVRRAVFFVYLFSVYFDIFVTLLGKVLVFFNQHVLLQKFEQSIIKFFEISDISDCHDVTAGTQTRVRISPK